MKKLLIIILSFIFFGGFIWASTSKNDVISRMYQNGLTKFDNPTDFMETKPLRRDEASKFFVQYSKQLLSKTNDETKAECNNFSDLNKGRSDLSDTMKDSCKLGLFQGNKGKFMPTKTLTKGQAITVLIRMIDGKKDETQGHFAQKYYERALELGILNGVDINPKIFDYLINRGDVARLLYNAGNIGEKTTSNNNGLSTVCINGVCTSGTSITCKGSVCTSNTANTTSNTTTNGENSDLIIESLIANQRVASNTRDTTKYYGLAINYVIKNGGSKEISISYTNPLKLNCYYNGVSIMNTDVAIGTYNSPKKIGAGGKISGSIGTYQHFSVEEYNSQAFKNVKCVIDEDNIIIESNENNNERYIDSTL